MKVEWSTVIRLPQTYGLLTGTVIGYLCLLGWAGPRPLVWLGGGGVAVAMMGSWVTTVRSQAPTADASDLLMPAVFEQQLTTLESNLPPDHVGTEAWQQARQAARSAQACAVQISHHDSLLHPDLLEAVHTVLELIQQIADALRVLDTIQTPVYQQMVQERLQQSGDRLQQTQQQLQQLQDQVALASLDANAATLPQRLQQLIAANQQILEAEAFNPNLE